MKKTVSNLNLEIFSIAERYCTNALKKPHICQNDLFCWLFKYLMGGGLIQSNFLFHNPFLIS